jgi:hypothetical protein
MMQIPATAFSGLSRGSETPVGSISSAIRATLAASPGTLLFKE